MGGFSMVWARRCIVLIAVSMAAIHVQGLFEMHFHFEIPNANTTSRGEVIASYCNCKNFCFAWPACKAVTVYNTENRMECTFSTHDIGAGHLIPNTSAVTFLVPPNGYSCPETFTVLPGVGCVHLIKENKTYQDAREHCLHYNSDLFVAETPEHFLRLVHDYFFNYLRLHERVDITRIYVGIENDTWIGGRMPKQEIEWANGEPNKPLETCAFVKNSTWKLHDIDCSRSHYFVCERKMWN